MIRSHRWWCLIVLFTVSGCLVEVDDVDEPWLEEEGHFAEAESEEREADFAGDAQPLQAEALEADQRPLGTLRSRAQDPEPRPWRERVPLSAQESTSSPPCQDNDQDPDPQPWL